ncbi:predicted protein [Naegleria gruberi]|uniref:Predicted protein n=1 Tax=Naegleria gruberi TaxID=5762 RepID=D2V1W8_NAEGR|nr:uncharacterized protein NAEGRDRAFT_62721 [Naegleria gruberi]EFC49381.1 predicted protein [Naegleria gruberi]|eukprot:XP_002682125.1 predicted protein [Naegleria gruberi strain NEG-M]
MRSLLFYLLNYDCVTFYDYLETLRLSDGKSGIPSSTWLTTDTASDIYQYAKDRIYTVSSNKVKSPLKKQKTLTQMESNRTIDPYVSVDSIQFHLEENPKWKQLENTIESIYETIQNNNNPNINGRVLILASNEKTCSQIRTYLELGGKTLLNRLIHKLIGPQIRKQQRKIDKQKEEKLGESKKKKGVKRKSLQNSELDLLSQHVSNFEENQEEIEKSKLEESILVYEIDSDDEKVQNEDEDEKFEDFKPPPSVDSNDDNSNHDLDNDVIMNLKKHPIDEYFEIIPDKVVKKLNEPKEMQLLIHSLYDTSTILDDLMPSFVILYENDLSFIRRIEHYQCKYPYIPLHVYLLSYDRNSVEYKQYQATVEREKEAFKKLIVSYGRLTIVIDAREFRSTLPSLLNSSGYKVIPIQISVGDYIVSKHCCVERKSTTDLWQSLNSGRLFQQSEKMIKYYKHAVLLIQFEQDEAFVLPDPYSGFYSYEDGKIEEKSIMTKLVLTALHFPKLKIAYSRTPAATGKFFYMMKHQVLQYNDYDMEENEEDYEPDVSLAQAIGTSEHVEENESSNQAIEFLARLPGVTVENMPRIINSVTNLYELADMSVSDLSDIMQSKENAKKLYDYLRESIDME